MTAMRHVNPFLPLSLVLLIAAGCQRQQAEVSEQFLQHAAVEVQSEVLKQYAGVYRLPSGALLSVTFDGERLRAGTPPAELLAQTSRRFTSNRITAEIHFQRDDDGHVRKLDFQLAKRSHWCERVDPASAIDPTQMVDAGGVRLRMLVLGEGRPTIVLEDGFGSGIEIQSSLQAALAKVSRVVAYDHAGTGGSEAGVEPRDGRQIAGELHTALTNAGIEPPYILVGASIGAEYCRIFADSFAADTAALVLLDPTPDWNELLRWAQVHAPQRVATYHKMSQQSEQAMNTIMGYQEPARRAEWLALDATRQQALEALPLTDVPVVQITGAAGRKSSSHADDKVRFFEMWLSENMPHAKHIIAPHSAHAVSITDQQLVVEQLRKIIDRFR